MRKCTGAVLGANRQKVNAIAAVGDVETILQATQTRYMARCMADPSTTADIWKMAHKDTGGRPWDMTDQSWVPKKGQKRKDGYQMVAKRLLHTLETDREGRISWGRNIAKFNLQETTLNCSKDSPAPYW